MFLTILLLASLLGSFAVALSLVLRFIFGTLCFVNACCDDNYFCNYLEMGNGNSYFEELTPAINEALSEIKKAG